MPAYTLYYFNGRGRAEILRMIFSVTGVPFTDKRFEFTEWEKIKNEMPTMRVPVLDIDGKNKLPETMAIARYLAREYGFTGKSNMDMFKVDYICDCLYEVMHDFMRYFHAKNGRFMDGYSDKTSVSEILKRKYMETCSRILPFLERSFVGNQFFMGDQMMLCDMMSYCFLETLMMENQAMFKSYPKLLDLYKRVGSHPKLIDYMKKRPKTNW